MTILLTAICSVVLRVVEGYTTEITGPTTYCNKTTAATTGSKCQADVELFVNRLNSVHSFISYEYKSFDFCYNTNGSYPSENWGQVLMGDRIIRSPYKIQFNEPKTCEKVCDKVYKLGDEHSKTMLEFLKNTIKLNYQHNWIADNLPVTWCYEVGSGPRYCSRTFPIGCYVTQEGYRRDACVAYTPMNQLDTYYIFNHVDIEVQYHQDADSTAKVVSVNVNPRSIRHGEDGSCDTSTPMGFSGSHDSDVKVTYTYSVTFKRNLVVQWKSRWEYNNDSYAHEHIQIFSIVNSVIVLLFLSGILAIIMLKNFCKDWGICKRINASEVLQGKADWLLAHDHVFCSPSNGMLLSVFLGSGVHIASVFFVTLLVANTGFLSAANPGYLCMCVLILFLCLSILGGFVSAIMYTNFGGQRLILNAALNALLCPGVVFVIVGVINFVLWSQTNSAYLPGYMVLVLAGCWLGISVPLTVCGSYFGFRSKRSLNTFSTTNETEDIPKKRFYKRCIFGVIFGGVLPFGVIFIQCFFIFNSIWSRQLYDSFGFLFITYVILILTIGTGTILFCYFNLKAGDYYWLWRAFISSGFCAIYFLCYSIHYFVMKLEIHDPVSTFLYFSFTFVMVFLLFLLTGAIGFFACFLFINKMYCLPKSIEVSVVEDEKESELNGQMG